MNKLWYGFWISGIFLAGMNCALNLAKLQPSNSDTEGSWGAVAFSLFFSVVFAILAKEDINEK
jgi:hypothetical protein